MLIFDLNGRRDRFFFIIITSKFLERNFDTGTRLNFSIRREIKIIKIGRRVNWLTFKLFGARVAQTSID